MANSLSLSIMFRRDIKKASSKKWRIRVPGKLTATGKVEKWAFRTKDEAVQAQKMLLESANLYGGMKKFGSPDVSADAIMAQEILKAAGMNLSLQEVVKQFIQGLGGGAKVKVLSISVSSLFEEYEVAKVEGWRSSSKSNYRNFGRLFKEVFGDREVSSLDVVEVEGWMSKRFPGAVYFNTAYILFSAVFNWGVKRELIRENLFARIEKRKVRKVGMVDVFSMEEAKGFLLSCRDFRLREVNPYFARCNVEGVAFSENYLLDCRDVARCVAVGLFAGLRPNEIERLKWEDVLLDQGKYGFIRVLPEVSKTGQFRNVEVTENLRAWLEVVPSGERTGRFVPSNYKRKMYLVRMAAGLLTRRDAARHSYASYWLAMWLDVNALRENLGHETKEMLFKHYRTAVLRRDAVEYWGIVPSLEIDNS